VFTYCLRLAVNERFKSAYNTLVLAIGHSTNAGGGLADKAKAGRAASALITFLIPPRYQRIHLGAIGERKSDTRNLIRRRTAGDK
jgi:hypothetical protein